MIWPRRLNAKAEDHKIFRKYRSGVFIILLNANVAIIQKPVSWFAEQIEWPLTDFGAQVQRSNFEKNKLC